MTNTSRPKRGSMAYSPRKRAKKITGRVRSWPEVDGTARLQGFAGYKAGMTHAIVIDPRPKSTTSGQEIQIPVTVIEVPPMKVAAVRFYRRDAYGLQCYTEVWNKKQDKELDRLVPPKKGKEKKIETVDLAQVDDVRVLMHTIPKLVSGLPKKKPELIEVRIGGGTIEERVKLAKDYLGKELKVTDFITEDGMVVDVISITKGKGFQGAVRRWGVKLLAHKNSKHRRQAGTMGPWRPHYVMRQVPLAGQTGFHQRTEHNKHVLKVGENGEEVTPNGGFLRYGKVDNGYVLIYGSIPGTPKRLIRLRDAARNHGKTYKWEINYLSTASKQGR